MIEFFLGALAGLSVGSFVGSWAMLVVLSWNDRTARGEM